MFDNVPNGDILKIFAIFNFHGQTWVLTSGEKCLQNWNLKLEKKTIIQVKIQVKIQVEIQVKIQAETKPMWLRAWQTMWKVELASAHWSWKTFLETVVLLTSLCLSGATNSKLLSFLDYRLGLNLNFNLNFNSGLIQVKSF